MMLLCNNPPQMSQITTTESMPGLIHNTKKLIQPSGKQKLLKLLKVDTKSPPKEDIDLNSLKPQMFQITTIESMLGLTHNTKKPTQLSGKLKLLRSPKVDTMSPPKEDQEVNSLKPQMSQITTTESMPGLIHNTKKLTQLNGKQKLLKLLKVDTMSLLKKDPEFQETL
jgi:hypothetical protein